MGGSYYIVGENGIEMVVGWQECGRKGGVVMMEDVERRWDDGGGDVHMMWYMKGDGRRGVDNGVREAGSCEGR